MSDEQALTSAHASAGAADRPAPALLRFAQNTVGRDFAVGDIHGCFTELQRGLDTIGFDAGTDRLFSVGDPESHPALRWLDKPWFHEICGNNDFMAWRHAIGQPYDEVERSARAIAKEQVTACKTTTTARNWQSMCARKFQTEGRFLRDRPPYSDPTSALWKLDQLHAAGPAKLRCCVTYRRRLRDVRSRRKANAVIAEKLDIALAARP